MFTTPREILRRRAISSSVLAASGSSNTLPEQKLLGAPPTSRSHCAKFCGLAAGLAPRIASRSILRNRYRPASSLVGCSSLCTAMGRWLMMAS